MPRALTEVLPGKADRIHALRSLHAEFRMLVGYYHEVNRALVR